MQNEIVFKLKGYHRSDEVATGFVSYCPSLNVFSHGKTETDAKDNLWKAVRLYLENCLKIQTFDKVLKDAGFVSGDQPTGGTPIEDIEQEFIWVRERKFDTAFDMAIPVMSRPSGHQKPMTTVTSHA